MQLGQNGNHIELIDNVYYEKVKGSDDIRFNRTIISQIARFNPDFFGIDNKYAISKRNTNIIDKKIEELTGVSGGLLSNEFSSYIRNNHNY